MSAGQTLSRTIDFAGYEVQRPGGAFYVFPKVPWGTDHEFVAEAIRNQLLIIPGSVFSERDTHIRISYAAADETIASGLDILRTLSRDPEAAEALQAELDSASGADHHYDEALKDFRLRWPALPPEPEARFFAERAATLLTASVLLKTAPAAVADGYIASRVTGTRGATAGTVPGLDTQAILTRAAP